MDLKQFPVEILDLDEVKPYWRNPRRITDEAVNAVAESIRQYGYQQPVVVDAEHVIIIGHTRYAALRRLGVQRAPMLVADLPVAEARQLRVIDNRVAEFTSWDFDALVSEMADLDSAVLGAFFPEVTTAGMDRDPLDDAPRGRSWDEVDMHMDFVCPGCFHSFSMEVTREAILAGRLVGDEGEESA